MLFGSGLVWAAAMAAAAGVVEPIGPTAAGFAGLAAALAGVIFVSLIEAL
jgi:hypothetical protein